MYITVPAQSPSYLSYSIVLHANLAQVWIDGLGNPNANKMANCQLRRLISHIQLLKSPEKRSESSVHLWIDTFCIPANVAASSNEAQSNQAVLKAKAISLMTPIYARAEKVLIVDSELEQLSHQSLSLPELTARLHICGWMGRAWTLQEGSLAVRPAYQFQDGILFTQEGQRRMDEALKVIVWGNSFDEQSQLLRDCRSAWHLPGVGNFRAAQSSGMSARDTQFQEVWNGLNHRDTTKTEDLYVIVAK